MVPAISEVYHGLAGLMIIVQGNMFVQDGPEGSSQRVDHVMSEMGKHLQFEPMLRSMISVIFVDWMFVVCRSSSDIVTVSWRPRIRVYITTTKQSNIKTSG